MASPDTLIVDYRAAIGGGGKTPVPPLRTPLDLLAAAKRRAVYSAADVAK